MPNGLVVRRRTCPDIFLAHFPPAQHRSTMVARSAYAILIALLLTSCHSEAPIRTSRGGPFGCGVLPRGWKAWTPLPGDPGVTNSLLLAKDGTLRWNGSPVSERDLRGYVDILKTMNPIPDLDFHAEPGASCTDVQHVQRMIQPACITEHIDKCSQLSVARWRLLEEGRMEYTKLIESEK